MKARCCPFSACRHTLVNYNNVSVNDLSMKHPNGGWSKAQPERICFKKCGMKGVSYVLWRAKVCKSRVCAMRDTQPPNCDVVGRGRDPAAGQPLHYA